MCASLVRKSCSDLHKRITQVLINTDFQGKNVNNFSASVKFDHGPCFTPIVQLRTQGFFIRAVCQDKHFIIKYNCKHQF